MNVYRANIQAVVTATLRVIAETVDEASEKAQKMIRNDVPHDIEVTGVSIEEEE